MTQRKDRPSTKNRGVHTTGRVENIQNELRTVIDHMGPDSPDFRQELSVSEVTQSTTSIIEIESDDKEVIHQLVQDPNAKPLEPNTPRDYSELSSLVTDSIAVYIDNKPIESFEDLPNKNFNDLSLKLLNPIQKISNFFTKHPGTNQNQTPFTPRQQNNQEAPILPPQNLDLYRINILQPKSEAAPKRVIFDLVEDPVPITSTVATNTSPRSRRRRREAQLLYRNANCVDNSKQLNEKQFASTPSNHLNTYQHSDPIIDPSIRMQKKTIYHRTSATCDKKIPGQLDSVTRVDVYYFDHGNSAYYHTTDCPPVIMTEILAEKTENYTTKFWAETFGFVHIIFSFITSFILQFLRSVLQSFIRPLTVGVLQIFSDYCIKPLLATIFNALVQPPLIFVYNIATTIRDICDPIAEGMGYFFREIATVFGAIRLVDVKYANDGINGHKMRRKGGSSQESNVDGRDLEHN